MSKSPLRRGSPPTAVWDLDLFSQCGFNRTEGLWEWRTCEGGRPLLEQTNKPALMSLRRGEKPQLSCQLCEIHVEVFECPALRMPNVCRVA